jgi:hypothetical protein
MMSDDPRCALWYYQHGTLCVDVCSDEAQAVWATDSMQEYGTGAVRGVQFSDGTYVDRAAWPALKAHNDRQYREMVEQTKSAPAPPPCRTVRVPWDDDQTVEVLADLPAWVGRQLGRGAQHSER